METRPPKTLRDVLTPPQEGVATLRWQVAVPICTNLFLLLELFQFALMSAALVLLVLCTGVWFTEQSIAIEDIASSVRIAGMVLLAVMAGFVGIAMLFFGNRYYATYHLDAGGIYYENTRGSDTRGGFPRLRFRPFPVVGPIRANHVKSRVLSWEKIDRFQDIASMRAIILRRGYWHMLRLYTPDSATHGEVVKYLTERLQ